jgi:hypothetical protein
VKEEYATFAMKAHCSTEQEARARLEPFIKRWELAAVLKRGPGEFGLEFEKAQVIDRQPSAGIVLYAETAKFGTTFYPATLTLGRNSYPSVAENIAIDPDVEVMCRRYALYREGKDTLAAMAYFCLTVIESSAGNRSAIKSRFGVSISVTSTLGRLSSEHGGMTARKSDGVQKEFTSSERNWLEQTISVLIFRAAEIAHDQAVRRLKSPWPIYPRLTARRSAPALRAAV